MALTVQIGEKARLAFTKVLAMPGVLEGISLRNYALTFHFEGLTAEQSWARACDNLQAAEIAARETNDPAFVQVIAYCATCVSHLSSEQQIDRFEAGEPMIDAPKGGRDPSSLQTLDSFLAEEPAELILQGGGLVTGVQIGEDFAVDATPFKIDGGVTHIASAEIEDVVVPSPAPKRRRKPTSSDE